MIDITGIGVSNGFPSMMALMKSQGASKKVIAVLSTSSCLGITFGPFATTFIMNDNGKEFILLLIQWLNNSNRNINRI